MAWSYAAMLLYVTVALSVLPQGARLSALLVHSRAVLALSGVCLVAAAVVAALGESRSSHFIPANTYASSGQACMNIARIRLWCKQALHYVAGLCAGLGMWATLIILEVIPFLALAVGVDNMFILAHAAARQPAVDPATGCAPAQ